MARKISDIDAKKVLAVVGAGHMEGLVRQLENPNADIEELEYVPEKKRGIL